MRTSVYVASMEGSAGKSALALGVLDAHVGRDVVLPLLDALHLVHVEGGFVLLEPADRGFFFGGVLEDS